MKSNLRWGLKTKLHASTFALLTLVALVAGWFFLKKGKTMLQEEYRKRGLSMAMTAAQQLEYGLLTADEKSIKDGLEPYLNDPDLIDIQAYSCTQEKLFASGQSPSDDAAGKDWCEKLTPGNREHTQRYKEKFRFYMLTKGTVPRTSGQDTGMDGLDSILNIEEPQLDGEAKAEESLPIGFVRVDLSLDELKRTEKDFTQFIVLVVLSIMLAALVLMGLLAQRMVGPIHQLVSKVKIIGRGNLDEEIPSMGSDEIGELADAFAQMKDNLKRNMREIEHSNKDLVQAQKWLEQKVSDISALYELEKGIGEIIELDELLDYITERAISVLNAEAASLLLTLDNGEELEFKVAKGPRAAAVKSYRVKMGQGIAGCSAMNREPILSQDVSKDPRYDNRISHKIDYPVRDVLCVPMVGADNSSVIGVVEVMNKQAPEPFNEADMRLLELISGQASKAIERARYIERERNLASELSEARLKAEYLSKIETAYEEKTEAYEQLREAQQQLVQSEKLATVGTLAGGVAHEINNPLGAILTNAQMLDMYSKDDDSKANVKNIIEGARRCKSIVEKLLSYSRPSKGDRAQVDVNRILDDTLALLGHQLSVQNITIEVDHGAAQTIAANGNEISQVLTNLILNGAFAVNERAEKEGPDFIKTLDIKTENSPQGDEVIVSVTDNGTGISRENLAKIFDPFFTTKVVGQGTGLGLSVSFNIVRAHGGRIEVRSDPGQGSTFSMHLPLRGKTGADQQ